jgi:hypothetical protein
LNPTPDTDLRILLSPLPRTDRKIVASSESCQIVSRSIGFCRIRQSSGIPIVCFQQSKQTLAHTDQ